MQGSLKAVIVGRAAQEAQNENEWAIYLEEPIYGEARYKSWFGSTYRSVSTRPRTAFGLAAAMRVACSWARPSTSSRETLSSVIPILVASSPLITFDNAVNRGAMGCSGAHG